MIFGEVADSLAMPNDETLWMKMALAALAQGSGFLDALDAADKTIARLWVVREQAARPSVAKCGCSSSSAPSAADQAIGG